MNRQRIYEIVCVVALVIFIVLMSTESSYSKKTVKDVYESVTQSYDVSDLGQIKRNQVRKDFGFDFSGVDAFSYYASDAIMNVDELMIIKLREDVKPDEIMSKIEKRVSDKQVLFDGYAPEQSALLENYVLTYKKGFIFYCVGEDAKQAHAAFKSTIR